MSELSPQARALIEEARCAEGVTGARRGRIRGALVAQLGTGAAVSTGAAVGAASTAGKVAGGASVALAMATKVIATVAIVSGVGAGSLAVAVHWTPYVELPGRALVAVRGSTKGAPPAKPPAVAALPSPNPVPVALPFPNPVPNAVAPAALAPPGALPAASVAISRPAAATGILSATVASPGTSLESETHLLREANFELRAGRPERALALLDEHTRLFSHGSLVEERRVERILALCALGRAAEAQSEGASFLKEQPRSLLADRVRASCGHAPERSDEP